jgi:hypothetical protein
MKSVIYIIPNLSSLLSITKKLKLKEEQFTLSQLDQLLQNKKVSVVYSNNKGVFDAKLDYTGLDLEEISSECNDLFSSYILDKNFFSDFRYKMIFNENEEIMSFLTKWVEDNNFLKNIVEVSEGEESYIHIAIVPTYNGQRKIYNISSDKYLFFRRDEFESVDFDHFKDILFVREFLDLSI